jgi:hypothetical protein
MSIDEKKWEWHSAIIDDDMDDPPGELEILQGPFATTEEARDADWDAEDCTGDGHN